MKKKMEEPKIKVVAESAPVKGYTPTVAEERYMKELVEGFVSDNPFDVDFGLMTDTDKFHMERMSKNLISMFTKSIPDITEDEIAILLNFGQNTMLGTYMIHKLGKVHLQTAMKARVKDKNLKRLEGLIPNRVLEMLETGNVWFILDYYRYIGEQIAEGNYTNFVAVFYHDQSKQ